MSDAPENQQDDAVIGRAFRVTCWVILVGIVSAGAVFFLRWRNDGTTRANQKTPLSSPQARRSVAAQIPNAKFTDITAASGIKFRHVNGAYGEKLLPETMGGGVAFLDFDNNGAVDLLFINSTYWPWDTNFTGKPRPTMALYRNDGRGHFTD